MLIRADAGQGVGLGHVARCLALAEQLIRGGADVTIAMRRSDRGVVARVRAAGATLRELDAEPDGGGGDGSVWAPDVQRRDAREALGESPLPWDAVVVDHYRLDAEWETWARARAAKMVVVDDLANRRHDAHVLIDHNWYGEGTASRYAHLVGSETLQLLGPRYCLLDAAYRGARASRRAVRRPPRTALISFGGTDAGNQTLLAARAALASTDLRLEVVVGSRAALSDELEALGGREPRMALHVAVPSLATILARVDLVVGAGGTGTWERLCMGVPSIVTTISDEQSGVTRALAEANVCQWLGTAAQVREHDYRRAFERAARGDLPSPPAIVDGYGASRAALAILGAELASAASRPARPDDDASYVSAIASADPDSGPRAWREAHERFRNHLRANEAVSILHVGDVPVGVRVGAASAPPQETIDAYLCGRRAL